MNRPWVDAAIARYREDAAQDAEELPADYLEETSRIVDLLCLMNRDSRFDVVWTSLERLAQDVPTALERAGQEGAQARAEALENGEEEQPFTLSDLLLARHHQGRRSGQSFNLDDMTHRLGSLIDETLQERPGLDTRKLRRQSAAKIARLAAALGAELDQLPGRPAGDILRAYGDAVCDREINSELKYAGSVEIDPNAVATTLAVVHWVTAAPTAMLDSLSAGVKAWANETMTLPQPNDENARRTYFIRRLSMRFRSEFGQPLHECVQVITAHFFPGTALDVKSIAKLATP